MPAAARKALKSYRNAERAANRQKNQIDARLEAMKLLASGNVAEKNARALRLYTGIDDGIWRNGVEVAHLMNISKERVRQLLYPSKLMLEQILGSNIPWRPVSASQIKTTVERSWKEPRWLRSHNNS